MIQLKKMEDKTAGFRKDKDFLYHRKGVTYAFEGELPPAEKYTFVAEFADNDPGFAFLSVNGMGARAVAGYTSCGTGRIRTGVFILDASKPEAKKALSTGKIEAVMVNMPGLLTLSVVPGVDQDAIAKAKEQRAKPHEVQPLFTPDPWMQLIVSVGADAPTREGLPNSLESMREQCPYFRRLGFNGIESYVKWNFIEYEKGKFDWSFYDSVIELAAEYGMGWFPLIIGGSAYALPEWYREHTEGFTGFTCLEHGQDNNVPTIFNEQQTPYVKAFLHELGRHFEGNKNVFGVRLGPSGNYGESQYPATGNWGYKGLKEHMHIGWWAKGPDANRKYATWLAEKYKTPAALSAAWEEEIASFDQVETYLPYQTNNLRKRKDFVDWYMFEMTDWCNRWAVWVREELKSHDIYQSSGGWGFCEAGTDFTDQTEGMVAVNGGIRATNEDESYELNFAITRMLSSAARFYDIPFGSEPAGYSTARGVINRLYNIVINNGQHLFYYGGNFFGCDESAPLWNQYAPLLNERAKPLIDVAVMYPDTLSKLSDSAIRWLDGSSFFSQVFPFRRKLDYDFCSERMVMEGALEKQAYKALVFLTRNHDGDYIEADVLNRIDEWVQNGGTVIYPITQSNCRRGPITVEGDQSIYHKWLRGKTGKGRVIFIHALREPLDAYIDDVAEALLSVPSLDNLTKEMLLTKRPRGVYLSALETGKLVLYNDLMKEATVTFTDGRTITMEPISIEIV